MADQGGKGGKGKRLRIVNGKGELASYQGKRMEFEDSERERAEMIVFLLNRQAIGGPFRLIG